MSNLPRSRDSAAIACPGNRLSVEKRQGRYKKDKRRGLNSFSGEFWGLRGAANLGQERSRSVGTVQVRLCKQESGAHWPRLRSHRSIKQARRGAVTRRENVVAQGRGKGHQLSSPLGDE